MLDGERFEVTHFSLLEGAGAGSFAASSAPTSPLRKDRKIDTQADLSSSFHPSGYSLSFQIVAADGEDRNATNTFKFTGNYCGFDKSVDKSKLRRLLDLSKDSFTIKCVLTVIKEHRTKDLRTAIVVPLPQSSLHKHFLDMLKGGEGADVTFTVGGQSFLAHRCVLAARSPVFKAELFGKMNETLAQSINIDGMEPSIFEALLHFIYTDSLPDDWQIGRAHV